MLLQGSYISSHLKSSTVTRQSFCRLFTSGRAVSQSQRLLRVKDQELPVVVSDDGFHASFQRVGGYEPLPLPPHMDPVRIAQRNKWKSPKAPPLRSDEKTEFQRRLELDVDAQALATPVRLCQITQARLPTFFLLGFAPVASPDTDACSMLPVDLFNEVQRAKLGDKFEAILPTVRRRIYMQLRRPLLDHVTKAKTWKTFPDQGMSADIKKTKHPRVVWRTDMSDFVQTMLGELVVLELRRVLQEPAITSLQPTKNTNETRRCHGVACSLSLSGRKTVEESQTDSLQEAAGIETDNLDTQSGFVSGSPIRHYNLADLLGEDLIESASKDTTLDGKPYVVVERSKDTLKLQEYLFRLHTYLAAVETPNSDNS